MLNFDNILSVYNELCRNTRNKKKVAHLKEYKSIYVYNVHTVLLEKNYTPRSM